MCLFLARKLYDWYLGLLGNISPKSGCVIDKPKIISEKDFMIFSSFQDHCLDCGIDKLLYRTPQTFPFCDNSKARLKREWFCSQVCHRNYYIFLSSLYRPKLKSWCVYLPYSENRHKSKEIQDEKWGGEPFFRNREEKEVMKGMGITQIYGDYEAEYTLVEHLVSKEYLRTHKKLKLSVLYIWLFLYIWGFVGVSEHAQKTKEAKFLRHTFLHIRRNWEVYWEEIQGKNVRSQSSIRNLSYPKKSCQRRQVQSPVL